MRAPYNKPTEKTEKRISKKPPIPISQNNNLSLVELDLPSLIEKVLQDEHIQDEIHIEATKRLNTEESIKSVKAILSEYFDSFMVLGYDVDGDRLIVKHTKTDRDDDSMLEMLRYVFMTMLQKEQ